MACNSCSKTFSLLRKEKGCPGCGFSFCSKCLNNKVFLSKINAEAKVCVKCKRLADNPSEQKTLVEPPDSYYRRIGAVEDKHRGNKTTTSGMDTTDQAIMERLQKLKEARREISVTTTDEQIKHRLQNIKGEIPSTSYAEIQERLAKLRGVPVENITSKPILLPPDTRTEQEQANDLIKQYMEQTNIDTKYNEQFDELINDMEKRMSKLKQSKSTDPKENNPESSPKTHDSEDEDESVRKIVEKMKAEALFEDVITPTTNDELPFCEICNEDARMRCLGCRYLFCKQCFVEHRDDDDGCNRGFWCGSCCYHLSSSSQPSRLVVVDDFQERPGPAEACSPIFCQSRAFQQDV